MSKEPEDEKFVDYSDPEFNTFLSEVDHIENPTVCRNCSEIKSLGNTRVVKPAYRYCIKCYDKMVLIGQVVKDFESRDGTMIMLWNGDPFYRKTNDPTSDMFSEGFKVK